MGYGDEILGSGMARGALKRGKRIAFGDGKRILWSGNAPPIFKGNPNIASPGNEGAADLEWIAHYKHHRIYFSADGPGTHWVYDQNFRAIPGELFFDKHEKELAQKVHPDFILIEPKVKSVYPNKQWPVERYAQVAKLLLRAGYRVCQFVYDTASHATIYPGVKPLVSKSFRHALIMLSRARLFIGPEGGLAHGAAALGVRGVILFGGFTDPKILGYEGNVNLTGGASPCGSLARCRHCKEAMANISVQEVVDAALRILK